MLRGSARRWAQPGGPRDTKSPHDSLGGGAAHQDAARAETWGPLYGLGVHWYTTRSQWSFSSQNRSGLYARRSRALGPFSRGRKTSPNTQAAVEE